MDTAIGPIVATAVSKALSSRAGKMAHDWTLVTLKFLLYLHVPSCRKFEMINKQKLTNKQIIINTNLFLILQYYLFILQH